MSADLSQGIDDARTNDDNIVPKIGAYYHLTSRFRILPRFFIIGVQKGGSTSLAGYLQRHPEVIPAQRKDIFYFNNDQHYKKGLSWYRAHFALKAYKWLYDKKHGVNAITFDSTPNYFEAPQAAARLQHDFPDAKIILLLRNPVERAWSSYQMARRFGFEKLEFAEALAREESRLEQEERTHHGARHNYVYQRLSYKKRGIYIPHVKRWFSLFPAENILVLKSEDLFERTQETYDSVTGFLGLQRHVPGTFENHNPGNYGEKMDGTTHAALNEFYKPFNEELYRYLGQDYGWK